MLLSQLGRSYWRSVIRKDMGKERHYSTFLKSGFFTRFFFKWMNPAPFPNEFFHRTSKYNADKSYFLSSWLKIWHSAFSLHPKLLAPVIFSGAPGLERTYMKSPPNYWKWCQVSSCGFDLVLDSRAGFPVSVTLSKFPTFTDSPVADGA